MITVCKPTKHAPKLNVNRLCWWPHDCKHIYLLYQQRSTRLSCSPINDSPTQDTKIKKKSLIPQTFIFYFLILLVSWPDCLWNVYSSLSIEIIDHTERLSSLFFFIILFFIHTAFAYFTCKSKKAKKVSRFSPINENVQMDNIVCKRICT